MMYIKVYNFDGASKVHVLHYTETFTISNFIIMRFYCTYIPQSNQNFLVYVERPIGNYNVHHALLTCYWHLLSWLHSHVLSAQ